MKDIQPFEGLDYGLPKFIFSLRPHRWRFKTQLGRFFHVLVFPYVFLLWITLYTLISFWSVILYETVYKDFLLPLANYIRYNKIDDGNKNE